MEIEEAVRIKDTYVAPSLRFYEERVDWKRRWAQSTKTFGLVFSLSIPIVAVSMDTPKVPTSVLSALIALIVGLQGIFQWELTWREYSSRIVRIRALIAVWDLEIHHAKGSKVEADDISRATEKLLQAVESEVDSEMKGFFSARLSRTAEESKLKQPTTNDRGVQ